MVQGILSKQKIFVLYTILELLKVRGDTLYNFEPFKGKVFPHIVLAIVYFTSCSVQIYTCLHLWPLFIFDTVPLFFFMTTLMILFFAAVMSHAIPFPNIKPK